MKIKVDLEWLENNVFNHHPNVRQVIVEHGCVGEYQYDVNIKEGGKYGVRVGFFDERLRRKKFFITPTEGNYHIISD